MKKAGFTVSGWIIIALGIAGLALPFVPGLALILPGLVILSSHCVLGEAHATLVSRQIPEDRKFC